MIKTKENLKQKEKVEQINFDIGDVMRSILKKLDWLEEDPKERIKNVKVKLGDLEDGSLNEKIFDYITYDNGRYYKRNYVGVKKGNPLSEDVYFNKKIDQISSYSLTKYDKYQDAFFLDHTIISKNRQIEDERDRKGKRIVGLNTSYFDDNEVPKEVNSGAEIHIDSLDEHENWRMQPKEEEKKNVRKQAILGNLEKHPELREAYDRWKGVGLKYGLDVDDFTKEERKEYKRFWIDQFGSEEHKSSPKKRFYLINKMYNDMGYELSIILREIKGDKATIPVSDDYNTTADQDDVMESILDLTDPQHVRGMLTIQYDDNYGWIPVYDRLYYKYADRIDTVMYWYLIRFNEAVNHTDFTEEEREIVDLILNKLNESIYIKGSEYNPYRILRDHVNKKYDKKWTKANLVKKIENNISKRIANTYQALEGNASFKKCTNCKGNKLAIKDNFGADTRNSDRFKSICKRCAAKKQKNS